MQRSSGVGQQSAELCARICSVQNTLTEERQNGVSQVLSDESTECAVEANQEPRNDGLQNTVEGESVIGFLVSSIAAF